MPSSLEKVKCSSATLSLSANRSDSSNLSALDAPVAWGKLVFELLTGVGTFLTLVALVLIFLYALVPINVSRLQLSVCDEMGEEALDDVLDDPRES